MDTTPRNLTVRWLLARDTPAVFSKVREAIGTPEFARYVRQNPSIWTWADSVERVSAVKNLVQTLKRKRKALPERHR